MKHRALIEIMSKLITSPGMPVTTEEMHKTHENPDISVDEVARWAVNYRIGRFFIDKIIGSCIRG